MRTELDQVPWACALGRQAAGGRAFAQEPRAQEELAGQGAAVGQVALAQHCVRCSAGVQRSPAEKQEIIHLVEHSALPVGRTLNELDVPRSSFYRWYRRYQQDGQKGLEPQPSRRRQFCPALAVWARGTACLSRCATRSSSWPWLSRRSPPGGWPGSSPRSGRTNQPAGAGGRPGGLLCLRTKRNQAPEALRPGREPGLPVGDGRRSVCQAHPPAMGALADRLHLLQDPGLGSVLSVDDLGRLLPLHPGVEADPHDGRHGRPGDVEAGPGQDQARPGAGSASPLAALGQWAVLRVWGAAQVP